MTDPYPMVELLHRTKALTGLSRLADTEDGAVFYLVSDPAVVVTRNGGWFQYFGDDVWRELEHAGTGDPGQRVIVLHNTAKFRAPPAEQC